MNSVQPITVPDRGARAPESTAVLEPFAAARAAPRLLFDFGVMTSLMNPSLVEHPVLDFGAGSGWVSEFIVRMGWTATAFDIHGDLKGCLEGRARADTRVDPTRLSFAHGDGHAMPFDEGTFGHVLCYDTLHHMRDYPKVFAEFFRVLRRGGRAIFVEPGAHHSTSPETIAFVEAQKKHDPDWIERDVVLPEIDQIARNAGFSSGLEVVPVPLPQAFVHFKLDEWSRFRDGDVSQHERIVAPLASINYWGRIVFLVDKP